jgi:hypothetical protein
LGEAIQLRAEVIAKDNKYQLIDSFTVTTQVQSSGVHGSRLESDED